MKSKLAPYFFPLLLLAIILVVIFLNYQPGTFLTGWDTLHPEFSFPLNFSRLFFGVWRPDQGLGAVAGHSHMADLPRVIILWLLHFFLPLSALRYSYIFLCLILGPLGIYFLIKQLFTDNKTNFINHLCFLTALLYLLNLGTLQQFYVPFEMFPTQYAFLPWIILASITYLQKPSKLLIINFSFLILLSTPQAYAAHLWYPFFGLYCLFIVIYTILNKIKFSLPSTLILLTLVINSFWLLPNIYYIATSSWIPQQNLTNRLHSQEFLLKNRETGNLLDSTLIKGFYFNWEKFDFGLHQSTNLMPEWQTHLQNLDVLLIGFLIFTLSLVGLIFSLLFRDRRFIPFLPFAIIPFILLANRLPPFNYLFDYLIYVPIFDESLRFVFTKLSILFTFGLTLFFALALFHLFSLTRRHRLITVALTVSLFIYTFPYFQGRLISPVVKNDIPQSYFQLWQFMDRQPLGRILSLPLHEPSGWSYYQWGYQGSGLIWFGLPQSIFDRDSDRWSSQNEEAYREFFAALYANRPDKFNALLTKYQVSYLLWDQNLISTQPKNQDQITFKTEIGSLTSYLQSQNLLLAPTQFGSIYLYPVNPAPTSTIATIPATNNITPAYHWGYSDAVSSPYLTDSAQPAIDYPFRNLLTTTDRLAPHALAVSSSNQITTVSLPSSLPLANYAFTDPTQTENLIAFDLYLSQPKPRQFLLTLHPYLPGTNPDINIPVNSQKIIINDTAFNQLGYLGLIFLNPQKINFLNGKPLFLPFNFPPDPKLTITGHGYNFTASTIFELNPGSSGTKLLQLPPQPDTIALSSTDTTTGVHLGLDNLPHRTGYLVGVKSQYDTGIPLRLCFKNLYTLLCSLENQLSKNSTSAWDYFLIPPGDLGLGYDLILSNIAAGGMPSKNHLEQVVVFPLPLNYLGQIHTNAPTPIDPPLPTYLQPTVSLSFFYQFKISDPDSTLTLFQSYDPGWLAFRLDGPKPVFLTNHVLVNNWANGWTLPVTSDQWPVTFYILFWPQLLEFFGFGLLVAAFFWITHTKNK